ncbi:hypothetical protein CYMTET_47287 [Cymbomonas tetramitiformis]|uniref:Uncharacterized protein n=1 Tax=Cymbomonas tetramitiformis TaxID=36881 RepID=A0AAE0BVK8_9CHLO|nr:hypothetical protein CYMTET_47287 [Cymbomonas tetramitiformis]
MNPKPADASRSPLSKAMPYVSFSCATVVFSTSIVVFVGFNDAYNNIVDCDVDGASIDYKTDRQAMQLRLLSIVCMVISFVSFVYHFFTVLGLPVRHDKTAPIFKVWVIGGEISAIVVTNLTVSCIVSYYGYPFTTLSDLYDLGTTSQTAVVFKDCGVSKRDELYTVCLIVQLLFSFIVTTSGFVVPGVVAIWSVKPEGRHIVRADKLTGQMQTAKTGSKPFESWLVVVCTAIAFSMSCVTIGGFSEAYDDLNKCDVKTSSTDYKSEKQAVLFMVVGTTCFVVGALSFFYRVMLIVQMCLSEENAYEKPPGRKMRMAMLMGEFCTMSFSTLTIACVVSYFVYPFTTLSDLYDLVGHSQTDIIFDDCGIPKRDHVYSICLILQLVFSTTVSTLTFTKEAVVMMWHTKAIGTIFLGDDASTSSGMSVGLKSSDD